MPLFRTSSRRPSSMTMWGGFFWHSTCLKPTYTLRRQVFFSFGITGVVTTALVVGMACLCAISAGKAVQEASRNFMRQAVIDSIGNSSHFAADTFSQELDHLRGAVGLIVEIVRDRIANYPMDGWETDDRIPFINVDKARRYPLKSPLLPRDWNVTFNVNASNQEEHLSERFSLYHRLHDPHNHHHPEMEEYMIPRLSTASAVYSFQGNCDPAVTDPQDPRYYPGCTQEHNNAKTGGIKPTNTSAALEQKAADIGMLLKPIWESRPDLLLVSVHFVNEGAGSMVHFPSFVHPNAPRAYQSQGCDWMHQNTNPHTNRPFLTQEQTDRNCHRAGEWVDARDYNPMEQPWCRDQALNHNSTRFFGPQVERFFTNSGITIKPDHASDKDHLILWVMTVGRAIFDRYTGELIGCVGVSVILNRWTELILETLAVQNHSNAILMREEDGIVVAGGNWDLYTTEELKHAVDTDVVRNRAVYQALMDALKRVSHVSLEEYGMHVAVAVAQCPITGRVLSAARLPETNFIYVQVVEAEVFDVIDDIQRSIEQDLIYSTVLALIIGGVGMTILMIIVYTVSMVLTRPLNWIRNVAYSIVNHTTSGLERSSLMLEDLENDSSDMDVEKNDASILGSAVVKCTPDTEITELVHEFKTMLRGFSGLGKASTVAKSTVHEIRNTLAWQNDFEQLFRESKVCPEDRSNSSKAAIHTLQHCFKGFSSELGLTPHQEEDSESRDSDSWGGGPEGGEEDSGCKDPGVSLLSENDSGALEYQFRSSNRKLADHSGVTSSKAASPGPPDLIAKISGTTITTAPLIRSSIGSDEGWRNEGRNLNPPHFSKRPHEEEDRVSCVPFQSSLFRWILILIVIPMIVTNIVISTAVSQRILSVLPKWLEDVEAASFGLQLDDLSVASKVAALYAESVMATPVRDLFVYTRLAGWLFTDAVSRNTEAILEMGSGAEACKMYPESKCPWYDDPFENAPCDCSWEADPTGRPDAKCFQIEDDTRHMQRLSFAGQRHDADPLSGRRSNVSYPLLDRTAADTAWWDDLALMPGAWKGINASGYKTTYDRLMVFSALSVIIFPLYNYRESLVAPKEHMFLGAYFGFESDGMITGWSGCEYPSPAYPHFQSTEKNLAVKINSTLCPLGKFGFDPRCRGWYDTGKAMAQSNKSSIFITPPYVFASKGGLIASSVTQGVSDPRTGEHIGQTLIDFQQFEMLNVGLARGGDSFNFVITPTGDSRTGDTVVRPEDNISSKKEFEAATIGDLVLPYDGVNSTNRQLFDEIVKSMKAGKSCLQNFTRTTRISAAGGNDPGLQFQEETIWLAYDPIHVRALDAVQTDDYSRGLNVSTLLVYSLAVGRSLELLQKPFNQFKEDTGRQLEKILSFYIGMTILISLLAAAVACRISVAVTKPMIILLTVVQNINAGKIDEDIPPLHGGSREVNQVYTSFAKLYKIVRVSNSAFFMRNLHWACHFVQDALKLFTKIADQKAIAIASSNLGSTLLAINCSRPRESRCACLMVDSVCCCVKEAFIHFETAIQSGTEDFQNAATMAQKVDFAQQLADRHFNRALYFLLSLDDPCAEDNFQELGREDLLKAQALDLDVQEYWIQNGVLMEKASIVFERLLRRLHGLCALMENDVAQDVWDPLAVANDCHRVLSAVWGNENETLFREFTGIGRLQQLEAALINFQLQRDEVEDAARIAMRMLVEDEFINETAFKYAADAVLQHAEQRVPVDLAALPALSKAVVHCHIQNMLKSCKQTTVLAKKCVFYCIELSDDCHLKTPHIRHHLLELYDGQCRKEDFFGLVACNANNPFTGENNLIQLTLEIKQHREGGQRNGIESAIDALACAAPAPLTSTQLRDFVLRPRTPQSCKALSAALEKVVECETSAMYDSYIVFVTDGPKQNWDWKNLWTLKSRIEEMNAKRRGDIHLIMLDLEEEVEKASGQEGADGSAAACAKLCRVSKGSVYIKGSLNSLEEHFDQIGACLAVEETLASTFSSALMSGITMEKF